MCRCGLRLSTVPWFPLTILLLGISFQSLPAQQRRGQGRDMPDPALQSHLIFGYAADGFKAVTGGLSQEPAALGVLDFLLHLNLDALPGLRRTRLQLHVQKSHGNSISARVGDLQGVSNLEAAPEWRLHEAWLQRQVFLPGLSLLVGVYDVNSEFDVIPAAAGFLNSAFGFGSEYSASSPGGPSTYPSTGLAARFRAQFNRSFYALVGAGDGAPGGSLEEQFSLGSRDGALLSFEVGYRSEAWPLLSAPGVRSAPGKGLGPGNGPWGSPGTELGPVRPGGRTPLPPR